MTPVTGIIALAPGQYFTAYAPGYVGLPSSQEAGSYVTITVRAIEQNAWSQMNVSDTIQLSTSQPAWTVLEGAKNLASGEVEFYVRLLRPGLSYVITATDISGSLGSFATAPINVVVSPGGVAMTDYSAYASVAVAPGQAGVQVMNFTVMNTNIAGGAEFRIAGVTITTSEAVNSCVESVTVAYGSGITRTITWGNTRSLYLDLEDAASPTIAGQESRTYRFTVSIRAPAPQANITLSINSANDVYVDKLDATVVQVYPVAGAYPYRSSLIRIVGSDLSASFYSYPNPFAAGGENAGIQYYLGSDSKVSLYIYDLIGRKVRTLVEAEDHPGGIVYRREWDGMNDSGRQVLNGVYYGVLYVDGNRHITKIAVVK